jgi:hypothetical protein
MMYRFIDSLISRVVVAVSDFSESQSGQGTMLYLGLSVVFFYGIVAVFHGIGLEILGQAEHVVTTMSGGTGA